MPATTTTVENFDGTTPETSIKDLVALRMGAGAIRSTYRKESNSWVIETEWNVFGQQ